ncbi:MAG: hypothetical protein NXY57DRAFT_890722 [Lentinula lateritia]|uniref:Vacuolar sorting protein Vps3844 C-terminal domain-containing protein n=1 Tax=Lentinula lateritia TaxID=40482 RepID=A0ABQ8VHJ9_9AGAR|nr:MAG: hypothetical protein NXY57DRAFT_890722 [Lentinula lateritia]KAJ4494429.1 hypothetical protein C8R41DRAFT_763445 [Lentinula lateritia]
MMNLLRLGALLSALQLSSAVDVFLNPTSSLRRTTLSPEDASSALSQHLGLEIFEVLQAQSRPVYNDDSIEFVATGLKNALIVTMEHSDAKVILPSSLPPSFKLSLPYARTPSLSSVASTYIRRAKHAYSAIYVPNLSIWNPSELLSLEAFLSDAEESIFAALDLAALADLREQYGADSIEYERAAELTRAFLQNALRNGEHLQLAILTYSSTPTYPQRRSTPSQVPLPGHAPPQEPIGSISTCFTSADSCNNATSSCSGRGQCVEASKSGRTCFVCTCSASKTGEGNKVKTEIWVGESCERKDISGPFVLFVGLTIVMLILVFGSVSLLYGVGEQMLPPTLTGTAVNAKKD